MTTTFSSPQSFQTVTRKKSNKRRQGKDVLFLGDIKKPRRKVRESGLRYTSTLHYAKLSLCLIAIINPRSQKLVQNSSIYASSTSKKLFITETTNITEAVFDKFLTTLMFCGYFPQKITLDEKNGLPWTPESSHCFTSCGIRTVSRRNLWDLLAVA